MRLLRYVLRRLLLLVPVLLGVLLLAFVLTRILPADPISNLLNGPYVDAKIKAQLFREARLDLPVYKQFWLYLLDLTKGEMGVSYTTAQPVTKDLRQRFPATFEVVAPTMLVAIVIAIPMGVLSALHRGRWPDHIIRLFTTTGLSVPIFWIALVALQIFYFKLGWAPAPSGRLPTIMSAPPPITGLITIDALLRGNVILFEAALKQLVLPVLLLGWVVSAPITRMTRSAMAEALEADYVRCAYSLGLPPLAIVYNHAFRNAVIPVLTLVAAVFGFALGGAVFLEIIFAWPGMGRYAYEAIVAADFPAIQGFIVLVTVLYVLVYLLLDIAIAAIDPRVDF